MRRIGLKRREEKQGGFTSFLPSLSHKKMGGGPRTRLGFHIARSLQLDYPIMATGICLKLTSLLVPIHTAFSIVLILNHRIVLQLYKWSLHMQPKYQAHMIKYWYVS